MQTRPGVGCSFNVSIVFSNHHAFPSQAYKNSNTIKHVHNVQLRESKTASGNMITAWSPCMRYTSVHLNKNRAVL